MCVYVCVYFGGVAGCVIECVKGRECVVFRWLRGRVSGWSGLFCLCSVDYVSDLVGLLRVLVLVRMGLMCSDHVAGGLA